MTHALAANPRQSDLHSASITNNAFMFDPFVFPAGAFPIARRTKDAFTKKTTLLRLERPIVDRFGILDFALAPGTDGVMRCHTDAHLVESDRALFSKNFAKIRFVHIYRGKGC